MDIHRSRFVPYPTSAINALAFSRSSDSGYSGPLPSLKLAIGRANGNIEIWNPQRGSWVEETVFLGNGRSIDQLAWTQDPDDIDAESHAVLGQQRLFSIASSPAVTEWDLATGQPKRNSTGNFSEAWCMTAQPRWKPQKCSQEKPRFQDIVTGCDNGTLVLLSTSDGDLQFKRFLARASGKKAGCICLAYQSHTRVVAGFRDGMIRVYDTRNGSLLRGMSLGVSVPGAPKNVSVWQVKCLPNGDIVSADSNGEVKLWDGKKYSLLQRITGHETECVELVTSTDGKTVFSGSIDGKVAVYQQSTNAHGRKSWAKGYQRRVHDNDINAMAAFDSKGMSVVVSGGSDVSPRVTPLREFGKEQPRALPSLPQEAPVASAARARLLVSWWDKSICVWRIAKHSSVDAMPGLQKPRKLVARLNLNTKENIRSVSTSPDGKLLVASTSTAVKAFQLRKRLKDDSLEIRKLHVPDDLTTSGARLLKFSPDGKWLAAVTPDSEVYIVRFARDPGRLKYIQILPKIVELDRQHRKLTHQSALKSYDRTVARLAFSSDSSVLVAGDLSGYLDSWVLEGHEDMTAPPVDFSRNDAQKDDSDTGSDSSSDSDSSDDDDAMTVFYGQHWTDNPAGHLLSKLDSPPLVMTFRPAWPSANTQALVNGNPGVHPTRQNPHAHSHELPPGQHKLWVMTAQHRMYEFDVLDGKLSDWSRRNPSAVLPEHFVTIRDRVMGAVWDVSEQRERIWLYGSSFVFMINVGGNLDDGYNPDAKKLKRKAKGDAEDEDIRKRRKLESGGGNKIESSRKDGMADVIKRYEDGASTEVKLHGQNEPSQADDENDDDVGLRLTQFRSSGDEQEVARAESTDERKWWSVYRFRPILGLVPLQDEDDILSDSPLEVVIVERPLWDVQKEKR